MAHRDLKEATEYNREGKALAGITTSPWQTFLPTFATITFPATITDKGLVR